MLFRSCGTDCLQPHLQTALHRDSTTRDEIFWCQTRLPGKSREVESAPAFLLSKGLGYGKGYRYAHDEEGGFAAGERYFPDNTP
jgi:hypothetical protein